DSQAGIKGALATAAFLDAEGVDVRLVTLPRSDGASKIDLAEFLRQHPPDAFQALCRHAPHYFEARLATYAVSTDDFTNCQTARQFVTEVVRPCQDQAKALAFFRYRLQAYLRLRPPDIDNLIGAYHALQGQTPSPPAK